VGRDTDSAHSPEPSHRPAARWSSRTRALTRHPSWDHPGQVQAAFVPRRPCPRRALSSSPPRSPTVNRGHRPSTVAWATAGWREARRCFPSSRWAALGGDLAVNGRNASDNSGLPRPSAIQLGSSPIEHARPGLPTDSPSRGESRHLELDPDSPTGRPSDLSLRCGAAEQPG
jgi:hypothetical protein